MQSDQPEFLYVFHNSDYYRDFREYRVGGDYESLVCTLCPEPWSIQQRGLWTYCALPEQPGLVQGWKIHIAGVPATAERLLKTIVPILRERQVSFKFLCDPLVVRTCASKNWPRSASGKFITIYPDSTGQFLELLEACHEATRGTPGPYILSDMRYRDSDVVFYRYGEHSGVQSINDHGRMVHFIRDANGDPYRDQRMPYYSLPSWVADPFGKRSIEASRAQHVVLADRYRIERAARFSNYGGIYYAIDLRHNREVIIREARSGISTTLDGRGGPEPSLEKEARILERLGPLGLSPQFIELFSQNGHRFLVQEKLEAESLWGYAMNFLPTASRMSTTELFNVVRRTIMTIIQALETVHANGIILRDLTKSNVMFTRSDEIRLIDFRTPSRFIARPDAVKQTVSIISAPSAK